MNDQTYIKYSKALFDFKPQHTDELTFLKGDIICISQMLDGGWWEGSLNDRTGWFPSNFVTELSPQEYSQYVSRLSDDIVPKKEKDNYFLVIENFTSTEFLYVNELSELVNNYFSNIDHIFSLPEQSYIQSNFQEILNLHKNILKILKEYSSMPLQEHRIGQLFLKISPQIKSIYLKYCQNHPKSAFILSTKSREINELCENSEGLLPNIRSLTTTFSLPLRRLEKYSNILSELDRHIEKAHVDRGDIQRAVQVYTEISLECLDVRKRKEFELDVLNSNINGFPGETITQLGEVLKMSSVQIFESTEKSQQIIILFPGLIIQLSLTAQTNEYIYEGQIDVHNASIIPLEDTEYVNNALEIKTFNGAKKVVVIFTSSSEKNNWLQILRQPVKLGPANVTSKPTLPGIFYPMYTPPLLHQQIRPIPPQHHPHLQRRSRSGICNLRPYPPLRPCFGTTREGEGSRSPKSAKKFSVVARKKSERTLSQEDYLVYKKIDDQKVLEDDATLLNVIEAYCNSVKSRHTVNSTIIENPQMLIAEEEKLIFEEIKDGELVFEERTLVDTVYSLRDQINELKREQQRLSIEIAEERKERRKLENIFKMACKNGPEYINTESNNLETDR